jgi:hypothetical protein
MLIYTFTGVNSFRGLTIIVDPGFINDYLAKSLFIQDKYHNSISQISGEYLHSLNNYTQKLRSYF